MIFSTMDKSLKKRLSWLLYNYIWLSCGFHIIVIYFCILLHMNINYIYICAHNIPQACFFIEYILKYIFNVIIDVSEKQYRNNREQ